MKVSFSIIIIISLCRNVFGAEFNIDFLDSDDKESIDLSRFQETDYVSPGIYNLLLKINQRPIKNISIEFIERKSRNTSEPCFTSEIYSLLGLLPSIADKIKRWNNNSCMDLNEEDNINVVSDTGHLLINIIIPEHLLMYSDSSWWPSERWDAGLNGIITDYTINTGLTHYYNNDDDSIYASANGTTGINHDEWRIRGEWQSSYQKNNNKTQSDFNWNQFYAFRPLKSWEATFYVGENYILSDLYDSWRYTGAALISEERMLPPNQRGYAPAVSGIAKTNARVTISQQGRIIYDTVVAAGPFDIKTLKGVSSGVLDVRILEQDGSEQTFEVIASSSPFLSRPGKFQYKMTSGIANPEGSTLNPRGTEFISSEWSYGMMNLVSGYGGFIESSKYSAFTLGTGLELPYAGALSIDTTHSWSTSDYREKAKGHSWRFNYIKNINDLNSEVSLSGYRFSDRGYMSFSEYTDARSSKLFSSQSKEQMTVSGSKSFPEKRFSGHLSWSRVSYWDKPERNRYSLTGTHFFDFLSIRGASLMFSLSRSSSGDSKNDTNAYMGLSLPFKQGAVSYSTNYGSGYSHDMSLSQTLQNNASYRIQTGMSSSNDHESTYKLGAVYSERGDIVDLTTNASWVNKQYVSAGLSLSGGITLTSEGGALHSGNTSGGTRVLVSTDGMKNIPVNNNKKTNQWGYAVVSGVSSYAPTHLTLDVAHLPENAEIADSGIAQTAVTEGAIGYLHFSMKVGMKFGALIMLNNDTNPPLGASIVNQSKQEVGLVSDEGLVWLSGIQPGEKLDVWWGKNNINRCSFNAPLEQPATLPSLICQ